MSESRKLPIGVLVSGSGTNLQSIIDASLQGLIDAQVRVVVSDVAEAYALARARKSGIPAIAIERNNFSSRPEFEEAIVDTLNERGVELVCLAGFMRIIGATLLEAFPDRIINVHPALLPSFPGLHAQKQALDYGVKVAGCTVHFVDSKTDHGPVIAQASVEVREDDTAETLAARILKEEHRIYPEAIQLYAAGRLKIEGGRVRILG
ncbi:MAG: phosphoribosylglycinamide formyltransferase [bacterium]